MLADSGEDLDRALQLAQAATSTTPDVPEMMDTLGWVYYKKQLPQLAIPLFERCVEKAPESPIYQYHLGLAYAGSGDVERGRATLRRALNAKPDPAMATDIRQAIARLDQPN